MLHPAQHYQVIMLEMGSRLLRTEDANPEVVSTAREEGLKTLEVATVAQRVLHSYLHGQIVGGFIERCRSHLIGPGPNHIFTVGPDHEVCLANPDQEAETGSTKLSGVKRRGRPRAPAGVVPEYHPGVPLDGRKVHFTPEGQVRLPQDPLLTQEEP